jgi:hypothetical protein
LQLQTLQWAHKREKKRTAAQLLEQVALKKKAASWSF